MNYGNIIKPAIITLLAMSFSTTNTFAAGDASMVGTQPTVSGQAAGEKFLAENAKKEGVVTTASGLQYKVKKNGSGKKPSLGSEVTVKYKGTLIDGKVFDDSGDKTVTFPVNGVIPGWTEALQLMNEGSVWELYIPANLAYGERGVPGTINPNEVLVFDVELEKVK